MTFSCKRCSLSFRSEAALRKHSQRMHKKQKLDTLPSRATSPDACEDHVEIIMGTHNVFLFSGILGTYVDGKQDSVLPPFPVIQYNMIYLRGHGNTKQPALIADVVDSIFEPAFVVPVEIDSRHYILKTPQLMSKLHFLVLPMQYLLRDGYGSMDFTEQLHNTSIRTDKDTRKYLRETKEGRKSMYAKLLDTLRSNDIEEDFEDFELLQNLDLQNLEENDMG